MRQFWRRMIPCMTLTAFTVVHVWAYAQTMPLCSECPECAGLLARWCCHESDPKAACADECCPECGSEFFLVDFSASTGPFGEVLIRGCQNQQHPGKSGSPCPSGCSFCSVVKAPISAATFTHLSPASQIQWRVSEVFSCYISPFSGRQTPPPRD